MENHRAKPVVLVMQKQQSFNVASRLTPHHQNSKGIDLWVPFNQPAEVLEHGLHQIFGAQTSS
jgi:hypothetical protein